MHAGVGGSTRFNLDLRALQRQGHNQPTVSATSKELLPGHLHTYTLLFLDLLSSCAAALPFPTSNDTLLFREENPQLPPVEDEKIKLARSSAQNR